MSGTIKRVVLIFKRKEQVADKERFFIYAGFMTIVHLILMCIGLALPCMPVTIFNLLAAVIEIMSLCNVLKNDSGYFVGISIIYFLACFQSLFTSIYLGWTFGFGLYNPVMIPVLFYMVYMSKKDSFPKGCLCVYTLLNVVCTLSVRYYVYSREAIYKYASGVNANISFINNIICFVLVIIFSTLFILELSLNHDILEKQTEDLRMLADYDELTKLRNRRSMLDIWKNLTRKDYCVVMGDIDDFKKINDTYGHEKGDDVLKLVAGSMSGAVDKIDYVSRWGGEEFLMIVFGNIAYALRVIDKVQRELKAANIIADGKKLVITLTFGISECSGAPEGDIDELIRQADRRLYIGKRSGKNCIIIKDE